MSNASAPKRMLFARAGRISSWIAPIQWKRFADILVVVGLQNGIPRLIYAHVEVQGQYDAEFAERMFVYNYRLYDRYRQPVASLAVLADDQPGWRPDHFSLEALGCKHQLHTATQDQLDLWAEQILLAVSVEEVFKLD